MRCGSGTKLGESRPATSTTKFRIDCFAGPSFQDGSGAPCASAQGALKASPPTAAEVSSAVKIPRLLTLVICCRAPCAMHLALPRWRPICTVEILLSFDLAVCRDVRHRRSAQRGIGCNSSLMSTGSPVGVIRAGLRLGRSPTDVRSTPNSDRKFKAHLFVAMCQKQSFGREMKRPQRTLQGRS